MEGRRVFNDDLKTRRSFIHHGRCSTALFSPMKTIQDTVADKSNKEANVPENALEPATFPRITGRATLADVEATIDPTLGAKTRAAIARECI